MRQRVGPQVCLYFIKRTSREERARCPVNVSKCVLSVNHQVHPKINHSLLGQPTVKSPGRMKTERHIFTHTPGSLWCAWRGVHGEVHIPVMSHIYEYGEKLDEMQLDCIIIPLTPLLWWTWKRSLVLSTSNKNVILSDGPLRMKVFSTRPPSMLRRWCFWRNLIRTGPSPSTVTASNHTHVVLHMARESEWFLLRWLMERRQRGCGSGAESDGDPTGVLLLSCKRDRFLLEGRRRPAAFTGKDNPHLATW